MIININLLEGNSSLSYYRHIDENLKLNSEQFDTLWNIHPENVGQIKIFGKLINTPRYFQNFGNDYNFSNIDHASLEIPDILKPFLDWVNSREELNYNGILVNWYVDGSNYIGFHADDEKALIKNSNIYCFSFGHTRDFVVKSKNTSEKKKLSLFNNSLVIMKGECQKYYKHSIPKITSKKVNIGRRISVTIRAFK